MNAIDLRDESDLMRDGDMPIDPSSGTVPVPVDISAREATVRVVNAEIEPADLPLKKDPQAEAQILGMLMWAGEHAPGLAHIGMIRDVASAKKFSTAPHQFIFKAIDSLFQKGANPNPTAVHSELVRCGEDRRAGGISYLDTLTYSVANVTETKLREHASSIHNLWSLRGMSYFAREVDRFAKTAATGAEAVEFARAKLAEIGAMIGEEGTGIVDIKTCATSLFQDVVDSANGKSEALRTGLETFDDLANGGLFSKEVTVIAARTSVGKSALATGLSIGLVEKNPDVAVLYVSLEMPAKQFVRRMIAARSGVDATRIRKGLISGDEVYRISQALAILAKLPIHFVDSQTQTCASIEGIARRHAEELVRKGQRLAAIVIDHIHLVKEADTSSKKNRESQIAEISKWTIHLAAAMSCSVLVLAQMNRESEGQKGKAGGVPQIHHIRESGTIEQNANNILIVHRQRDASGQFMDNDRAVLSLAKARDGEPGIVKVGWSGRTTSFYDLPIEDRAYTGALS